MLKFTWVFLRKRFDYPFPHCTKLFMNMDFQSLGKMRSRLLYQSKKRGILENDILIGGFAEQNLQKMNGDELGMFDQIINGKHMEWDLYYYFTGKKEAPTDLKGNPIFAKMRLYVLNKK